MTTRYTFGDGDVATRRLELLAEAFEPTSRALMASAMGLGRGRVGDLGCGPGHTTRLVAATCRPTSTVGLDSSDRYVGLARRLTPRSDVTFEVHDVTSLPLPGPPFDGLYARLLLAHLRDPVALAERWRRQLRPGGVLVLEEVEVIETPSGALQDYERLVAALVAAEGACLYPGALLAPLGGTRVAVAVDAGRAARIYGMNLAVWRDDAIRRGIADVAGVDRIAAGLAELTADGVRSAAGTVTWVVRQLALAP